MDSEDIKWPIADLADGSRDGRIPCKHIDYIVHLSLMFHREAHPRRPEIKVHQTSVMSTFGEAVSKIERSQGLAVPRIRTCDKEQSTMRAQGAEATAQQLVTLHC